MTLIGRTIGRYEILSRLGAGGMGVVYKARDQKLGRFVALKFLPPQFSDETTRQRFLHEAQAASALDHPGICTIYEIGETDEGSPYLAMAFYEGETLRERQNRGEIAPAEATSIALQIARALAAAHAQGIIHRDIKPPNLFLTQDGTVKILDFGLAHRTGATRVTRAGTTVGTLPYMAPEQIRGEDTDERTDIWSLGVVFYESLTGSHPFPGRTDAAVLNGILNHDPELPSALRSGLPAEVDSLISQLLTKDRTKRSQGMATVATELGTLLQQLEADPALRPDTPTAVMSTTSAMSTATASIIDRANPAARDSVAVLSFKNLSNDPAIDWLGGGIAESISSDLRRISGIEVEPREKVVAALSGTDVIDADGALAVADRTGAHWAVWGSFQKAGNALRILTQLADATTGELLEPIKVDGALDDVFKLEDRIVEDLAARLDIELSDTAREQLAVPPTELVEAYEYCARGLQLVFQMNPESFRQAAEAFTKALELDPEYAMAHSGLGQMRAMRFIATTDPDDLEAAIRHLNRAIELDSDLGDPYLWLTYSYARQNRFQQAVGAGRRAVELEPRSSLAHYFLAVAWWLQASLEGADPEEWAEAMHHVREATGLAPRNQSAWLIESDLYLRCGQYEAAHRAAMQAAEIERSGHFENALFVGGQALLGVVQARLGRYDDARITLDAALSHLETTDHVYTPAFSALCRCQQAELLLRNQEYSSALPLVRQAREEIEKHSTSLAIGWFRIRVELLAAATFHRLMMTREERRALGRALELLESHRDYDFSGVWEGGTGTLLYELADFYAFTRQAKQAVETLESAVAGGWREVPRLRNSPGFGEMETSPQLEAIEASLSSLPPLEEETGPGG